MSTWTDIGARIASGFDIPPGGLVVLRDRCGRAEVLEAVVIAFEHRGITTVIDPASDNVLNAVLSETDPALLATWGRHRSRILELADGVVSLGAGPIPTERASAAALGALRAGREAMEAAETRRTLPFLAVAIPTPGVADSVGRPLADLDRIVGDSIGLAADPPRELFQLHITRAAIDPLTLSTPGCSLVMRRGDRPWLHDDGHISAQDLAQGATASNLPCGSIFTTVLEDTADGTVRIPEIADGHDVVLTFRAGLVLSAEGKGAASVLPWLAQFGPDAGRISHVGVGLNRACPGGTGWTILDEHRAGAIFLALGENRYLGGTNASTLKHDVVLDPATLIAGSTTLVRDGHLTV